MRGAAAWGQSAAVATGALARNGAVPGCNQQELGALRDAIGARPVWFAQDVPAAELDAVFLAHSHALRRAHRLQHRRPRPERQYVLHAAPG